LPYGCTTIAAEESVERCLEEPEPFEHEAEALGRYFSHRLPGAARYAPLPWLREAYPDDADWEVPAVSL
jgi:hypothetical protein